MTIAEFIEATTEQSAWWLFLIAGAFGGDRVVGWAFVALFVAYVGWS